MIYALAAAPGCLFAGLRDGRIYLSQNGGDQWRRLAVTGDPLLHVHALACAAA